MTPEERVAHLNVLIAEWREPGLVLVQPERVVPDSTNREGTGISLNHMHYIAMGIEREGFEPHDAATGSGHDIPIVVRERVGAESPLGAQSIAQWLDARAQNDEYFPPAPRWASRAGEDFFCSLGNGHFFQALNLLGSGRRRKLARDGTEGSGRYAIGDDARLRSAVHEGVPAIVLRGGMAKQDRKFVSQMHNALFEHAWVVRADGTVEVGQTSGFRRFSTFDGLAKHADSHELDEIVGLHMQQEARRALASDEL